MADVSVVLERAYREEWTTVVATVTRQVGGDVGLAEDAAQDAFAAAAAQWPTQGVPARPGAWLTVTARRRAIDRVRRDQARAARHERLAHERIVDDAPGGDADAGHDASGVEDDRLRLIFTCCHPALSLEARLALTLKTVAGLDVGQVARAFLTTEATRAQGADEGLGRVVRQRLLTAATVNGHGSRLRVGAWGAYRLDTALRVGHGNLLDRLILHLHIGVLPRRLSAAALLGLGLFLGNLLGLLNVGVSRLSPLERGNAAVEESLVVVRILHAVLAQETVILNDVLGDTLALAAEIEGVGARVELH